MSSIAELLANCGLVKTTPLTAMEGADGVRDVFVHAGQLFTSGAPARVTTVLGSCVSICMWDPASAVGGVNHYMLPNDIGPHCATPRYAPFAIEKLIRELVALGAARERLLARMYGGACVLTAFQNGGRDLGSKNVEAARQRLAAEQISVIGEDTGGNYGRKIVFHTDTGFVSVRRVG